MLHFALSVCHFSMLHAVTCCGVKWHQDNKPKLWSCMTKHCENIWINTFTWTWTRKHELHQMFFWGHSCALTSIASWVAAHIAHSKNRPWITQYWRRLIHLSLWMSAKEKGQNVVQQKQEIMKWWIKSGDLYLKISFVPLKWNIIMINKCLRGRLFPLVHVQHSAFNQYSCDGKRFNIPACYRMYYSPFHQCISLCWHEYFADALIDPLSPRRDFSPAKVTMH